MEGRKKEKERKRKKERNEKIAVGGSNLQIDQGVRLPNYLYLKCTSYVINFDTTTNCIGAEIVLKELTDLWLNYFYMLNFGFSLSGNSLFKRSKMER